jgi:hypothetical protein
LIESLEQRFESSLVWECLLARGVTKETLLKKWKRRALVLLGKAYVGLLEFKLARNCFKSALQIIQTDSTLTKELNEIQQLIVTTSKKLDKQSKTEKTIWSKAFKKQGSEGDLPKTPPSFPATPHPTAVTKKSSQQSEKQDSVEDIDLSEFGIENKKKNVKSNGRENSNNQVALSSPTQYLIFSIFSLGVIGAFVAFGSRFRNFKWRG